MCNARVKHTSTDTVKNLESEGQVREAQFNSKVAELVSV
jgi:hypothetical protein